MRRPYQVLVLPFHIVDNELLAYVFQRSNGGWWQFISGGGEDEESIAETAIRELAEETGIHLDSPLIELQSVSSIPVSAFAAKDIFFPENIYVIPEYAFAVDIGQAAITLSSEHTGFRCVTMDEANALLNYDSNRTALYELVRLFESGRLWQRHYDRVYPRADWSFNNDIAQVFHNMLRRSIPELEMMRNLVTMYGERYIQPGGTILDMGCSCGDSLLPFVKKHGAANRYVGVDRSEVMLAQAKQFFAKEIETGVVKFLLLDLEQIFPQIEACVILSVLTMQFLSIEHRERCLRHAYTALAPGGALLLVEKILGETPVEDEVLTDLYYEFKNIQGYSWQAIERKKMSLQNNMKPVTIKRNVEMLYEAGFEQVNCFWRCLNFAAWVAVKGK